MTACLLSVMPEGLKELTLPDGETLLQHNCLRWAGESKMATWKPVQLIWLEDDLTNRADKDADFLKFAGSIVISERAYQTLKRHTASRVEYLPVFIGGEARYILNVINVLDLMDKSRSKFKIYSDGNLGQCEHAYLNRASADESIYKVIGFMPRVFISDRLKSIIESESLTGSLIREYKNP